MQFDEAMRRRPVEIGKRHLAGVIGHEFPAATANGAEAVVAGFQDAARPGCAIFSNEEVEVELGAELRTRNGVGPEGETFESGVADADALEAALDLDPFLPECVGSTGVVCEVLAEAGETGGGENVAEVLLLDAIEEVEGKAAEVEPVQSVLPFARREKPEAEALRGDRVAEEEKEGFAEFLVTREGGPVGMHVKRAREMRGAGASLQGNGGEARCCVGGRVDGDTGLS